jgi:hypothetical protein
LLPYTSYIKIVALDGILVFMSSLSNSHLMNRAYYVAKKGKTQKVTYVKELCEKKRKIILSID